MQIVANSVKLELELQTSTIVKFIDIFLGFVLILKMYSQNYELSYCENHVYR